MPEPFYRSVIIPRPGESVEDAIAREQGAAASRAPIAPSLAEETLSLDDALLASPYSNEAIAARPAGALTLERGASQADRDEARAWRAEQTAALRRRAASPPSLRYGLANSTHSEDETSLGELANDVARHVIPDSVESMAGLVTDDATAADLRRRARDAGLQFLDSDYVDRTFGDRGLDVLDEQFGPLAFASRLVPFSDEASAAGSVLINALRPDAPEGYDPRKADFAVHYEDPALTYGSEADRLSERFAEARERSPRSAAAGDLVGMGLTGLLAPYPGRLAALRAPLAIDASASRMIAQSAARSGYESAVIGAERGADDSNSRPMARIFDEASLLDDADASRGSLVNGAERIGRESLGLLGDIAATSGEFGAIGTGFGAGAGGLQSAARRALVRQGAVNAIQRGEADALQRQIRTSPSASDRDELLLYMDPDLPQVVPQLDMPSEIGPSGARLPFAMRPNAADLVPDAQLSVDRLLREPFTQDPDIARVRAAGLHTVPQQRAAVNVFGPRGLSRRMDMYGVLREGELAPTDAVQARAAALRDQAGSYLQTFAARAEHDGVTIDSEWLADQIDAMADEYSAVPHRDRQSLAADLRAQAQLIRGSARALRPRDVIDIAESVAAPEPPRGPLQLEPPGLSADEELLPYADDADVTPVDDDLAIMEPPGREPLRVTDARLVPPPGIGIREFNAMRRAQAGQNRGIYSGSLTNPQEAHMAGTRLYRLMTEAGDRAYAQRYGGDVLGDVRAARDQFATGAIISPPTSLPRDAYTQPTLRRALGRGAGATTGALLGGQVAGGPGAIVGGAVGSVAGYAAENTLARYEQSILAALNSPIHGSLADAGVDLASQAAQRAGVGASSAEARASLAHELVRRIEELVSVNPIAFGQYSQPLRNAAATGTTLLYLSDLFRSDPEAALQIEASAMPENSRAEDDTDDLIYGDPPAPDGAAPPTSTSSDDTDDLIYGDPIDENELLPVRRP